MTRLAAVVLLALLGIASCGDGEQTPVAPPSWAKVAPEQIAEAKKHGVPVAFENDLGMRFVLIPAGTFVMGSPEDEEGRDDDETQHEVTISRPYYVQIAEVTNRQYGAYDINHQSGDHEGNSLDGPRQPVVRVTWDETRVFAGWLSGRDTMRDYRLPTEAEWEHACRAGSTAAFCFGDTLSTSQAHYGSGWAELPEGVQEPPQYSLRVASYTPNSWGIYDMHGNVWEWCLDWLAPNEIGDNMDPIGLNPWDHQPGVKSTRGGSWDEGAVDVLSVPGYVRSAERNGWTWWERGRDVGFRLVSPLPAPRSPSHASSANSCPRWSGTPTRAA